MTRPAPPLKNRSIAALLTWLVPGLGHFYQGRTGKGLLYGLCIIGLYAVGMSLGDWHNVYWRWVNPLRDPEHFRLYFLGQLGFGLPSLPALIQATLRHYQLDPILWGFMAEPELNVINALHPKFGKLVEVGSIYTTVAGLLNILAIYDAYDGPAYADDDDEAHAEAASKLQGLNAGARA